MISHAGLVCLRDKVSAYNCTVVRGDFMRDNIARQNRRCEIGLTSSLLDSLPVFNRKQSNRKYQTPFPVWCCPLVDQFEYICALLRRLFLVNMCEHDVIHKTGSAQHIATPPEEDRATTGYI